ncbi:uncharacterized protein LAESUDRAFT_503802 [Laetiporus sulphureus 93-53]|uniref:C2H2-type domain-containing protein n=1 Tax=Laetiporus sulphureus 93-53 TaxID=1314785 RepID=A0A165BFP7_9APHY|nr:uncharacterized protein LAESUDRAFT_503802 [Laetiporus sulphureus 93-53]KZT00958.1 hypothetical protein LAESUDRAFT_503802 [Laetiporus sulphureus 93-53]
MNWNDIFDFASIMSRSPSPVPYLPHHNSQDICSNFSCCGLALPDLHALLDHFEEHHVLVLARDGRSLPLRPGDLHDTFGGCSSLVLGYPQPCPPAAPESDPDAALETLFDLNPRDQLAHAQRTYMDIMERDAASDVDTASLSSESVLPSPNPSAPICLPPSLLTVRPPVSAEPGFAHPPASQPWTSNAPDGGTGKTKPHKTSTRTAHAAKAKGCSEQRRAHAKKRAREKAYKCPRTGCSKAYLNPNGLKYHLEKGTCTIDSALLALPVE